MNGAGERLDIGNRNAGSLGRIGWGVSFEVLAKRLETYRVRLNKWLVDPSFAYEDMGAMA